MSRDRGSPLDPVGWAPTTPAESPRDPDATLDLPESDQVAAISGGFTPGMVIGHFVVRKRLGEGGMGVVLAGHDADLGRPVAIKLVRSDVNHPAYRQRLLREAQAMARLEHPNIVRVYEVGSDKDRLFVAMELIDGVTLSTWLKVQRRSWREVVDMFAQVGAGLGAVHRTGLVHRDFKPDNVLVDRDGRAKVADFGLARVDRELISKSQSPELAASLTHTGVMMGTPGYMAPEQQFGGDVDGRADQYSYCVALREALLGGRPKNPADANWHGTPRLIRALIARGLSYEPSDRFANMDELLAALQRTRGRRITIVGGLAAGLVVAGSLAAAVVIKDRLSDHGSGEPVTLIAPAVADAPPRELPADAGMTLTVAPRDADAIALAPPDAGKKHVVHGTAAPAPPVAPADAGVPANVAAAQAALLGSPGNPVNFQGKPIAQRTDPGHLGVVRETIAGLGWDGLDPDIKPDDVDKLAGLEQAIGKVKLGMLERKRGKCAAATTLWTAATKDLKWERSGDEGTWAARAYMGMALCSLASGGKDTQDLVNHAWVHGNQDQARFVIALALYELDKKTDAHGMFIVISRVVADPAVQSALAIWLDRTGLVL